MRHLDYLMRRRDVVVVGRWCLHVLLEGAVHHDAGESGADRSLTHPGARAVILVHHNWNVWICFDRGKDQMAQKRFAGVLSGSRRALHDYRAFALVGGLHDRLDLLEIVDVEGRYSVAML